MSTSITWSDLVNKIKGVANKGAVSSSLNCGGSYTIPAGYHNGSGKITANSLSSQTSATASASNILSGKTAYVNGSKITGTMANKGTLNWSGSNTTYTVPAGYYSGGTLNSKTSYTNGYNAGVSAQKSSIKITSGTYTSNTKKYFTINGSSANRAYGTINPGGNPIAVFSYDPNRTDTYVIRFGSTYMCSCKFQYGVTMSGCSWTRTAVELPQTTTTAHTMNWYAAVY